MQKIISLSLLFLFIPLVAGASLDTNLYYGLRQNSNVTQLQQFLIAKGFLTVNATGNFYSLTLKAVKLYQTSKGISSTGYVGVLTRKAINGDLAANLSTPNQPATNQTGTTAPKNTVATPPAYSQGATNGTSSTSPLPNTPQNMGVVITSFKFMDFDLPINAGIIGDDHTIVVTIPDGADLTRLIPIVQLSGNATIFPTSGVMQDFTEPITYTVTNINGDTQDYIITVVKEGNTG